MTGPKKPESNISIPELNPPLTTKITPTPFCFAGFQTSMTASEIFLANSTSVPLKLSGEFHLLVAEMAGNQILADMLRDLVSRSSLIIAVYQAPGAPSCPPDEHLQLLAALERRDPGAIGLMVRHLDQVLADLRLEEPTGKSIDLRSVFTNGRRAL